MKNLSFAARVYVGAVVVIGAVLLVVFSPWVAGQSIDDWQLFSALLVISTICSAFKVNLPIARNASTMSVSYAVDFAAMLMIGQDQAMIISALGGLTQTTVGGRKRNPAYKILFSMASLAITVQSSGHIYQWISHLTRNSNDPAAIVGGLTAAITAYFLLNTGLIAGAIGLSSEQSISSVWQQNFLWSAPGYFIGGAAAQVAHLLVDRAERYSAFLAAIPLYLTYRAYRIYMARVEDEQRRHQEMSKLHLTTVEALALAIDAKDQRSHSHIRRMQVYAAALGSRFALSAQETDGLRTAALLHDIGKLAVPEHILSKPGALTEEELKKIQIHPVVGAEIIAQVPFPYQVAPLILSHHERWDGRGYPSGLKGEQIPLGARILAVIDFYDALISDRPYHPAMSQEAATQLVRQEAGRAFDPAVVRAFLDMLPELPALLEASSPSLLTPRVIKGLTPQPVEDGSGETQVLEDIALAHREIYALYEIAQVMGTSLGVADTMKAIAAKLASIVPFSCLSLSLYDEATDTLKCEFATGTDADVLRRISVKNGHGMTGWVARNRKPLVNARPNADLEASEEPASSTTLHSALVCPLITNNDIIGTLAVYHKQSGFYSEDHCRLLERVCEQAAAVISNAVLFEKTQQDSLTDPLTGLPNTRHLLMTLDRELARAERLKSEVAFIVMDVDDFKAINDSFGHQVGDRALQKIATVLRNTTRPYDICVRYAGDEFIVVLPGCAADEAESRVRDLQSAVESARFDARPGKTIELSMSAGAAVFPIDGGGYDSLLAIADARMYRDKTRRKKPAAKAGADSEAAILSENDLRRSAAGIL